jgi:hypothetical protein
MSADSRPLPLRILHGHDEYPIDYSVLCQHLLIFRFLESSKQGIQIRSDPHFGRVSELLPARFLARWPPFLCKIAIELERKQPQRHSYGDPNLRIIGDRKLRIDRFIALELNTVLYHEFFELFGEFDVRTIVRIVQHASIFDNSLLFDFMSCNVATHEVSMRGLLMFFKPSICYYRDFLLMMTSPSVSRTPILFGDGRGIYGDMSSMRQVMTEAEHFPENELSVPGRSFHQSSLDNFMFFKKRTD